MALRPRTAASLVVVLTVAFPLLVTARPRTDGANPRRPHAARHGVRSQAPVGRIPPAESGARQRAEGSQGESDVGAIVRWEDQNGAVHYTHRYEVPQSARRKVQRVYATIGTVPLDRTETEKSAPPREGAASAAAFPVITLPTAPVPPPVNAPQGSTTGP